MNAWNKRRTRRSVSLIDNAIPRKLQLLQGRVPTDSMFFHARVSLIYIARKIISGVCLTMVHA